MRVARLTAVRGEPRGIRVGTQLALLIVFGLLAYGTVMVFIALDAPANSASDTLRPFLLTMAPVWLVAAWAARIVLRSR